ncbi:head GIN domain-containing protein [Sphingorhabdus sp. Alg239-R122]|uniref:head GIN domain-containing protein n=1 Tax=Sphingorhabdus sp. Alg239-R122 TaxID=2305989 RepID=UPI0013DA98B2|nr:head GIN domain-containing protein [Sphingorhabdus sp. Alg239-R122]
MRNMKIFAGLGVAAMALALGGCNVDIGSYSGFDKDSAALTGADISGENFTDVALLGPDSLIVKNGPAYAISAEGDSDTLEQLRYVVKDGTLRIGRKDNDGIFNKSYGEAATITLTMPRLEGISVAGSGDAEVDKLEGKQAEANIAGSGNLKVAMVDVQQLENSIAGSGNITMAGSSDTIEISIAGSGDFEGGQLSADKAEVSIAGSGNASIKSDGTVEASIMGSGDVNVSGSAKCDSSIVGSGSLSCG